jgi:pyruvate,orthophosphate dikinase
MSNKLVYYFGDGKADGNATMKNLLGGKGANLAEMSNLGIPVPPGMTINTEVCTLYYKNKRKMPANVIKEVGKLLKRMEKSSGKGFGSKTNPLLVSVRSGARISMPGMMDTILNLGLNDETVKGLINVSGSERFGYDSYRRFINMFGNVVLGIDHEKFEHLIDAKKNKRKTKLDTDLTADDLKELVAEYKKVVKKTTGKPFPTDPQKQLEMAISAVFNSWNTPRAIKYRELHEIPHSIGTAVNIQTMVFGNLGETSGTGVCFTRDPSTGVRRFFGEFLMNAQGEDVVAGIRTPMPIKELKKVMPKAYSQLTKIYQRLEKHYRDMQDMEFTIENSKLYLLQTRTGKRTAAAAVRMAVEMVKEKLITQDEAVLRVEPQSLDKLLHPSIDPSKKGEILATGLPASPGAAVGIIVFNSAKAEAWGKDGKQCVLVRKETSPEDIGGMAASQGILTSRGGMTSHAAVVARGMGTPCVAGCGDLVMASDGKSCTIGKTRLKEGEYITLDGSTGEVILGKSELQEASLSGQLAKLMKWADARRVMKVRTNADTPADSKKAREFGAEGIGLCRTEHMFFEGRRIDFFREMILAADTKGREKALAKLLPIQRKDFEGIFLAMKGLPVTVRLLDPPLHEFLPHTDADIKDLAKKMKIKPGALREKVESLKEFNPMMGHRGCRLGITYPEIYNMQVRAIIEAALKVKGKGKKVFPEIMIPLVGTVEELKILKENARGIAREVIKKSGKKLDYTIGTMIEIPRAALLADDIAAEAEFFSFGTNDLTQMTFGFSRDDAGVFLGEYVQQAILEKDPFQSLDIKGVGKLIQMAVKLGRSERKKLKIGICGEHGGDPASVAFCHQTGFNYVSCSPFRVPIARLSAAQAAIREKIAKKKRK